MSGQVRKRLGFGTSDPHGEGPRLSGGAKAKRGSHLASGGGRGQCLLSGKWGGGGMKGRGSGGRARPQARGGSADALVSRAVNTQATVDPCPDSPSHPSPTRPREQPSEFSVVGLRSIVISFLRVGQLPGRRPWQALGVSRAGRDGQEVASARAWAPWAEEA